MSIYQAVSNWVSVHQTFVVFVFSGLISLYAAPIRRSIHEWPKTKKAARAFGRNAAFNQLQLLRHLHNNAYFLNLYVYGTIVSLLIPVIFFSTLYFFFYAVIYRQSPGVGVILPISAGIIIGKAFEMRNVFAELYDYDNTVRRLEAEVAKYSDEKGNAVQTGS